MESSQRLQNPESMTAFLTLRLATAVAYTVLSFHFSPTKGCSYDHTVGRQLVQTSRTVCTPASQLEAKFTNGYDGTDQLSLEWTISINLEQFLHSGVAPPFITQSASPTISAAFLCPFLYPAYTVSGASAEDLRETH